MKATDALRDQFKDQVGGCDVAIKSSPIDGPTIDRDQRLVKGMVTTATVDTDGDVVLPNFDTSYFPGSVKSVYLDHHYKVPGGIAAIGVCRSFSVRRDGAYACTFIRECALGDEVLDAIECGALRGQSIGFTVLESSPPDETEKNLFGPEASRIVRKSKLLEYSIVSMPANPDAIIQLQSLVSKGVLRRKSAVLMGLPDTPERKFWPTRTLEIRGDVSFVRAS